MRALAYFGVLMFSGAALAAETITYTYDARGRLVSVAHSGGPSAGLTTCYSLDPADNRSNKTTSTSAVCTGGGGGGPSFSVNNVSANEGSNLIFTVTKSGTATGTTGVSYATANGTASAADYTSTSGTLSFTTAQTSQTVTVPTTDDATAEGAETVLLNLSNPTGGATISDNQGVGTINASDGGGGGGNQPPVANFDNAGSMSCGDTMTWNVVANDTDPDGNYPLSLVSASGSQGLVVSVASSTDIQMLANASGTKSFTYVVQDSLGATANGSGTVTVNAPCN